MYTPCYYSLDVVSSAIVSMPKLTRITMSCPFIPPQSLFEAVGQCKLLTSFSLIDTPIDMGLMSVFPARLSRVNLAPVGQCLRIGDGPTDPRAAELTYFTRDWRRKHRAEAHIRGLREQRSCAIFLRQQAPSLTHLEISGDLCNFATLAALHWPDLRILVLYGHVPGLQPPHTFVAPPQPAASIWDALERMPALNDLRLLFSRTRGKDFVLLPREEVPHPAHLQKLASLTSFAISNACRLDGIFNYLPSVQKVAILAIVDLPRWPIALSQAEAECVISDIASSGCPLRHLRIIIEDKLTPRTCNLIATLLPLLEVLEIERCGYHDGKSIPRSVRALCPLLLHLSHPYSSGRSSRSCLWGKGSIVFFD